METPAQTATRLLGALQELTGQEGMYLRGGYYDLAADVRRRTAPLVEQLAALAGQPGLPDVRAEVRALVELSERHAAFMREKMSELGAEIRRTDQARQRVAQVVPAYGQPAAPAPKRFAAAG